MMDARSFEKFLGNVQNIAREKIRLVSVKRRWYLPRRITLDNEVLVRSFGSRDVIIVCHFSERKLEVSSDLRSEWILVENGSLVFRAKDNQGETKPLLDLDIWNKFTFLCWEIAENL